MHGLDVFLGFDWDVMSLFKIDRVLGVKFFRRGWGRDLEGFGDLEEVRDLKSFPDCFGINVC